MFPTIISFSSSFNVETLKIEFLNAYLYLVDISKNTLRIFHCNYASKNSIASHQRFQCKIELLH